MEHSFLISCTILVSVANALCSWNRAMDLSIGGIANTLNFVNGEWERDTSQSSGETFNGQAYWKQTNYDNCHITTLWLYYYYSGTIGEYQWLISPTFGSTPASAYVRCNLPTPQPADPVECNGQWLFANNGNPSSSIGNYALDQDYNLRDGDCPQLTCSSLLFESDSTVIYSGTYQRLSTNDQADINVYKQSNSESSTGEFYLYFNQDTFSWVINERYDTDCEKAVGGTLVATTEVGKWNTVSATAGNLWEWFEPDVALDYRRVTCQGAIPTTSPSASDSTGYPTPSPTKIFDCSKVQGTTFPSCEPTVFVPTDPPSPTSKPVVNYPTAPTTYNPDTTSSASTVSPSLSFSPSPSSKAFAFSFCLLPLLLILSLLL